jgi:rhodanese-related sulfurtransferase/CBS domain-containing protein
VVVKRCDTELARQLLDDGAQVVEVLPASAYEPAHLPGAVNVPLPGMTPAALADHDLRPELPTVVYCYDHECDLSSRAAALLDALGYTEVYDYVASKTGWMGEGLPTEGTARASARAGTIARSAPTCTLDATVGDLHDHFGEDDLCVVVDESQTVLGVVRRDVLSLPASTGVLAAMQPGPPSVRPSITASELAQSMEDDARRYVLVTTGLGRLLGLIARPDLDGQH